MLIFTKNNLHSLFLNVFLENMNALYGGHVCLSVTYQQLQRSWIRHNQKLADKSDFRHTDPF
jgi:hypothetical protein